MYLHPTYIYIYTIDYEACTLYVYVSMYIAYVTYDELDNFMHDKKYHVYIHTHTYIHTYIHTYVRTYIHTYIDIFYYMYDT